MQRGHVVTVKLYGGRTAQRRLVAMKGDVVVVCAEKEWQDALAENREPNGLGFPVEDVMLKEDARKGVRSEFGSPSEVRRSGD